MQVFERCHELEVIDIVPARWHAAQDLLQWQTVSFAHTHIYIQIHTIIHMRTCGKIHTYTICMTCIDEP